MYPSQYSEIKGTSRIIRPHILNKEDEIMQYIHKDAIFWMREGSQS